MIHLDGRVEQLQPARLSQSTVIEVWIERLDERLGEDFGWQRVDDAAVTGEDSWAAATASGQPPKSVQQALGSQFGVEERLKARALLEARPFDWLAIDRFVELNTLWQALWEGTVTVPASSARQRLVIAEFEEYLVDDKSPYDKVPTRKERRLVFVEHIEIA